MASLLFGQAPAAKPYVIRLSRFRSAALEAPGTYLGSKSTDLERVRKGLRSDDTHEFLRALGAVLREALRCQQVTAEDAGAVAQTAVEESHQAAMAELVLLLLEDRWMTEF